MRILFALLLSLALAQSDPSYDHQTVTYTADFTSATLTDASISVTPFFSPDWSVQAEVWFVDVRKLLCDSPRAESHEIIRFRMRLRRLTSVSQACRHGADAITALERLVAQ
jgi:hypothetical protein